MGCDWAMEVAKAPWKDLSSAVNSMSGTRK